MPTTPPISQSVLTSSGNLPPREGAGALLLWTAILVIGGVCAALGANQQRKSDLENAQRGQVAAYLQGQANQFVSNVIQAAAMGPGSQQASASMLASRERTRQALSVLQQGGSLSVLGVDLPPLPQQAQAAARTAQMSLTAFDQAATPILNSAQSLADFGASLSQFDQSAADFAQAAEAAQKMPRLSTGPWGNAIAQVVSDLAPDGRPMSSAILAATVPANDPRLIQLRTRVSDMHNLARASVNESSMSQTDRAALSAMARAATGMLTSMDQALKQRQALAQLSSALPGAIEAAPAVDSAVSGIVSTLARLSADSSRQWLWVSLLGWGLLFLGAVMLVRQGWDAINRHYRLLLDGRNSQVLLAANDRLSNRLRRILSLESREEQLKESPDSPVFTLATLINKILEQRQSAAAVMEEHGQQLLRTIHELDALVAQLASAQQDADRMVGSSHINTGHFAGLVAQSSEDLHAHRQSVQHAIDQVSRLSGLTQGALWKLDQVREKTQDASKRIKRLGESAQAVSSSSDSVRDIARQAKVLALNLAIGAAQRGEDGRIFAEVAKELESLANDLDTAVGDINFQANGIQDDSRQTVEVMEQGVASIVECARMSGDATAETKSLLSHVQEMDKRQEEISESLAAASKGVMSEQNSLANALLAIRQQGEKISVLRDRLASPRSTIQAFRSWLGQLGRDI